MCEICHGIYKSSCPVCGPAEIEAIAYQECEHCHNHFESELMTDHFGSLLCPDCLESQKKVEADEDAKFKHAYSPKWNELFGFLNPVATI